MAKGTVKWFNTTKGYGFITPDDGEKDAFVHISEVERSGMGPLTEGQRVNFQIRQEARGLKAVNLAPDE
jgi:cold shock protein